FRRLRGHQFEVLYSEDTLLEYILKLKELGIPDDRIQTFLELVLLFGVHVPIQTYHLSIYPPDEKDICFLLCAVNGNADYLISYDHDFLDIAGAIERLTGIRVCTMLDFLKLLRCEE
ncbi:MAG: PIN domain-containing protein, partial [Candidatus Latescibacteria bacterium]|nr:PIN domain-containing protein [Candidatus Latescibacterota bacterium]